MAGFPRGIKNGLEYQCILWYRIKVRKASIITQIHIHHSYFINKVKVFCLDL